MIRFLSFLLLMTSLFGCETGQLTSTPAELEGVWIFKGYQQAPPDCVEKVASVTFEVTRKGEELEITGQSFINHYFSKAKVSFNKAEQRGTISFEGIGGTKMGGPQEVLNCETTYYKLLASSTTIKIEGGRLYLGREPRPVDSKFPETLIFEKKGV